MKNFLKKLNDKKAPDVNYSKKERLIIALLTSLTVSFIFILFGPVDIYANNKQEFAFTFSDFILPLLIIFFCAWTLLFLLLYIFKGKALNIAATGILSAVLAGFINSNFINRVTFVSGDAKSSGNSEIISLLVFALIISVLVTVSLVIGKRWKSVIIFLCVLFLGMNGSSFISDMVTKDLINDNDIGCDYVLSEKNLFTVSEKENIIYILFDRFDTRFYDLVVKDDPDFFNDLDGFTFYDKATSVYTRTFPGVPYMISGVEYFAQSSAEDYLATAYKDSLFLDDLKKNGYDINIYADIYYEYNDAKALDGIADNVEKVTGYTVDKKGILEYLLKFSFARYSPYTLTTLSYRCANNGIISTLSNIECENTMYHDNDAKMYQKLLKDKVTYSDSDKNYTFMYLHGCHTPFILDENCQISDNATKLSQAKGSFRYVYEYLEQLKKAGVYDSSTIVIAGDHGLPSNETIPLAEQLDKGVMTCIFFKPANSSGTPLKISHAPASSENIIPSLVKDAQIKTDNKYSTSLFDLDENTQTERIFYQSVYNQTDRKLGFNKYIIKGDAENIENWNISKEIKSDFSWY